MAIAIAIAIAIAAVITPATVATVAAVAASASTSRRTQGELGGWRGLRVAVAAKLVRQGVKTGLFFGREAIPTELKKLSRPEGSGGGNEMRAEAHTPGASLLAAG